MNDGFLNFLNVERENIVGKQLKDSPAYIVNNQDIQSGIKKAFNGTDSSMELSFQKDDTQLYFRIKFIPTSFEDGEQGVTLCMEDITKRKRAEEALRESEAKYSAVVENISDGIVVIQDRVLKFVNSASLELVGYSPEELMETNFINRVAQEHRETVMNRYTGLLKGEDVPTIFEIALLRKDGSALPVELNAARIDYKGRPAVLVLLRKIAEREKSEETTAR